MPPAYQIDFDPASHRYTVDGVVVPSVTQVLQEAGLGFDWDVSPYYADLGTRVHHTLAAINRKTPPDQIAFDVEPFVRRWEKFLRLFGPYWLNIEEPRYHPVYRYAGCPDAVGILLGHHTVVDIKTGQPSDTDALQTAGYALLLSPKIPWHRTAVYLGCDPPLVKVFGDTTDLTKFVTLVRRYHDTRRSDG